MYSTRKKYRPLKILEGDLINVWANMFNESHNDIWNVDDGIKGLGEGACIAKIKMVDGYIHEGKFEPTKSRHAEMSAIFGNALQTQCHNIKTIEITSPPCPCCAVVLESLGLSDKVITRKVQTRRALSYNMSEGDFLSIIKKVVPEDLYEEADHYIDSVYSFFASGQWYDIADTNGLIK